MAAAYGVKLCERGHRVTVVHRPIPQQHVHGESGAQAVLCALRDGGARLVELGGLETTYRVGVVRRLVRIIDEAGGDCIIGFQQLDRKFALAAGRIAGLPCIVVAGNQHHFWGPRPLPWLKRVVYARLLRRDATAVVCTSEAVRDEVVRIFGVDPSRTAVIPNGLDRDLEAPDPQIGLRESIGGQSELVGINVGRLDKQKGQDVLMRALQLLAPEARERLRMVFVGSLPESRNAVRMKGFSERLYAASDSSVLKDTVVFTGWRNDVASLLSIADFYVHASRWEGPPLPVAVLEAMAANLPIIVTDCAGHPDGFNNGEHGFVVRGRVCACFGRRDHINGQPDAVWPSRNGLGGGSTPQKYVSFRAIRRISSSGPL